MAEAVISLRQLNITFGTHTVLDNIDLEKRLSVCAN